MKRVIAAATLALPLLSGCSPSIEFGNPPPRLDPPAVVSVSEDLASFLQTLGKAYGSKDGTAMRALLANDFLYQGMDKEAFLKHLAANRAYYEALEIRPVQVTPKGEAVELVGYGMMPRGPLAPSLQLLPLTTGATLVKEDGRWKLRGNQQWQEQVLYRDSAGIGAVFAPGDLEAYRALLPKGWEMPSEPLVQLSFVEWREVLPPQTPYRLAQLNIRVSRGGQEAWFYVEMPETDWFAVAAGKAIGFPKYMADVRITPEKEREGWQLGVSRDGVALVAAEFVTDPAAMSHLRQRSRDGVVVFPKGPSLLVANVPIGNPGQPYFLPGWMTIKPGASGIWQRLLPADGRVAGVVWEAKYPVKQFIPPLANLDNK